MKIIANSLLAVAAALALASRWTFVTHPFLSVLLAMLAGFAVGVFMTLAAFKASFAVTPQKWHRLIDMYERGQGPPLL